MALMRFILLYRVGSMSWVLAIRIYWLEPQKCSPRDSITTMLACLRVTSDFIIRSWSQFKILFTARSMLFYDSSLSLKPTKSRFNASR